MDGHGHEQVFLSTPSICLRYASNIFCGWLSVSPSRSQSLPNQARASNGMASHLWSLKKQLNGPFAWDPWLLMALAFFSLEKNAKN